MLPMASEDRGVDLEIWVAADAAADEDRVIAGVLSPKLDCTTCPGFLGFGRADKSEANLLFEVDPVSLSASTVIAEVLRLDPWL